MRLTCSYHDSTGYVQIQAAAALESMVLTNLPMLERCYLTTLKGESTTEMDIASDWLRAL